MFLFNSVTITMYRSIDCTRIRNLKVVAMLKTGQRLRTKSHYYSIDEAYDSFLSYIPVSRFFAGETKIETVDSITRLVESCVKQTGLTKMDRTRLSEQLKSCIEGINNLTVTYKSDSASVAALVFIIEMIEDFIVSEDPNYVRQTKCIGRAERDEGEEEHAIEYSEEEVSD